MRRLTVGCVRVSCAASVALGSVVANDQNVQFVLDFLPSMPVHVIGDALRLKQVLINLLNNAVKVVLVFVVLHVCVASSRSAAQ